MVRVRCPADERPELHRGTVEYLASKEYVFRPPMAPAHVFLIDVSQPAQVWGWCCGAAEG